MVECYPTPGEAWVSVLVLTGKDANKALEEGRGQEDAGAQTGLTQMSREPQNLRKGRAKE